jgi:hypothetical protein
MNELKNFNKFIDTMDKNNMIDLLSYLKDKEYSPEVIMFFLNTFMAIYRNTDNYKKLEPSLENPDLFSKRNIDILKKIYKINFVTNINEDDYFLSKIVENTEGVPKGYIKDENNHYIPSENPTYICNTKGLRWKFLHWQSISILFDEVEKKDYDELYKTLVHELTHVTQDGFEMYWYIMNKDNFVKFLQEGHAISSSRIAGKRGTELNCIPTSLKLGYSTYRYLYFKIEFLLGHDLLNEWAVTPNSFNFLSRIYKILDEKYGDGTFVKLYKYIEIILFFLHDLNNKDARRILDEKHMMMETNEYCSDTSEEEIVSNIKFIYELLNDCISFKTSYDITKILILFDGMTNGISLSKVDDEYTEYNHRIKLEKMLKFYLKQLQVSEDYELYEIINKADINICKTIMINSNYLNEAIINLENLMADCILKDIHSEIENEGNVYKSIEHFKLYDYYVIDEKFNTLAMQKVKDKFDYIRLIIETFQTYDEKRIKKEHQTH